MAYKRAMQLSNTEPENATPSHEELLVRVGKSRDREAFIALFHHYAPRLKSWLMGKGTNEALVEELVQNAMTTVWEKAKSYNPAKAGAGTWIFTIARNKRIDALRQIKYPELDLDSPEVAASIENTATDEPFASPALYKKLGQAVKDLPPEQSELLKMAYFENKSHQDIATERKLPLGTVKSRLRLAMEKLRTSLNDEGIHP